MPADGDTLDAATARTTRGNVFTGPNTLGTRAALPLAPRSASGVIPTSGDGPHLIVDGDGAGRYYGFPSSCRDSWGVLHLTYTDGDGHNQSTDQHIVYQRSRDFGRSWSDTTRVATSDVGASRLVTDPDIACLDGGGGTPVLILSYIYRQSTGASYRQSKIIRSTDHGQTWSGEIDVDFGLTTSDEENIHGPVQQTSGLDTTYAFAYGRTGHIGNRNLYCSRSLDLGLTWASCGVILNGSTLSQQPEEPHVRRIDSLGTSLWALAYREDGSSGIYWHTSTDPESWPGTPALIFPGAASPFFTQTASGLIVLMTRDDQTNYDADLRFSYDYGGTWTGANLFDVRGAGGGGSLRFMYGDVVELAGGLLALVYSMDDGSFTSDARIDVRYLLDGRGFSMGGGADLDLLTLYDEDVNFVRQRAASSLGGNVVIEWGDDTRSCVVGERFAPVSTATIDGVTTITAGCEPDGGGGGGVATGIDYNTNANEEVSSDGTAVKIDPDDDGAPEFTFLDSRLTLEKLASGAAVDADASLVLDHEGHSYIQFTTDFDDCQGLLFGDTAASRAGYVEYCHITNDLVMGAGAGPRLTASSNGNVAVGNISQPVRDLAVNNTNNGLDGDPAGNWLRLYYGHTTSGHGAAESVGDWRINIDAAGLSGDKAFIVGHNATGAAASELFRVAESGLTTITSVLRLEPRPAAPVCSATEEGHLYVDSDSNELCFCDGTSWTGLKAGGACS